MKQCKVDTCVDCFALVISCTISSLSASTYRKGSLPILLLYLRLVLSCGPVFAAIPSIYAIYAFYVFGGFMHALGGNAIAVLVFALLSYGFTVVTASRIAHIEPTVDTSAPSSRQDVIKKSEDDSLMIYFVHKYILTLIDRIYNSIVVCPANSELLFAIDTVTITTNILLRKIFESENHQCVTTAFERVPVQKLLHRITVSFVHMFPDKEIRITSTLDNEEIITCVVYFVHMLREILFHALSACDKYITLTTTQEQGLCFGVSTDTHNTTHSPFQPNHEVQRCVAFLQASLDREEQTSCTRFFIPSLTENDFHFSNRVLKISHVKAALFPTPSFNILVVDDSVVMRKTIQRYLSDLHHKTFFNSNAEDAIIFINQNTVRLDMLITDNIMGDILGIDFILMLRNGFLSDVQDIPIIMLTGDQEVSIPATLPNVELIRKPFTKSDLACAIDTLMKKTFSAF